MVHDKELHLEEAGRVGWPAALHGHLQALYHTNSRPAPSSAPHWRCVVYFSVLTGQIVSFCHMTFEANLYHQMTQSLTDGGTNPANKLLFGHAKLMTIYHSI